MDGRDAAHKQDERERALARALMFQSRARAILGEKESAESIAAKAPNLASKARQYVGGIVSFAIHNELREDGLPLARPPLASSVDAPWPRALLELKLGLES